MVLQPNSPYWVYHKNITYRLSSDEETLAGKYNPNLYAGPSVLGKSLLNLDSVFKDIGFELPNPKAY